MLKNLSIKFILGFLFLFAFANAEFKEYPIGEEVRKNNMSVAGVYLKPIDMEPRGVDRAASLSDIHLEADIKATKGNKNGFGAGEWIPFLTVTYKITNIDTGKSRVGTLMPMVAIDGPHYGANVKMLGVGNYVVEYTIEPPSRKGFGRHTDKDSGVGKWFKPFTTVHKMKYKGL